MLQKTTKTHRKRINKITYGASRRNDMQKNDYGNFGKLAKRYEAGRKDYPDTVIDFLWSFLRNKNSAILDLGCGTGIAARQIARRGGVITGCDKDIRMINAAKRHTGRIKYVVAMAETLPFRGAQFDAVTAFASFHWFANQRALAEIRRVLKPSGLLFIVTRNDASSFKKGYRDIFRKLYGRDLPDVKKEYRPKKVLERYGFRKVRRRTFRCTEYFSLKNALDYMQSVAAWNLMSQKKPLALRLLETYCKSKLTNGFIVRKLNVTVIYARK